MHTFKGIFSFP